MRSRGRIGQDKLKRDIHNNSGDPRSMMGESEKQKKLTVLCGDAHVIDIHKSAYLLVNGLIYI